MAFLPSAIAIILTFLCWIGLYLLQKKREKKIAPFVSRLIGAILLLVGLIISILLLPLDEATRDSVLAVAGLVVTGIVAFASTSWISNIMAGIMLRLIGSFRLGDFIKTEKCVGRVTEIDLFHVEIQTEDRDLMLIPNSVLTSAPFTVIESSGTIISGSVSLGYDQDPAEIEEILIGAADEAELQEPFVQIRELGDFSITYRLAGFLPEVRTLISSKASLLKCMVNHLHGNNVEIVSPSFMNQRRMDGNGPVMPIPGMANSTNNKTEHTNNKALPEKIIFDKADKAARITSTAEKIESLEDEIAISEVALKSLSKDDEHYNEMVGEIKRRNRRLKTLQKIFETLSTDQV